MSEYKIDEMDRKILSFLVKDARMPFLEIARECGVSGAAIHQRVKKLEDAGIITGFSATVKPSALGSPVCAFIMMNISEANKFNDVIAALKKIPEVVECHFITGHSSMLIKLYCSDFDHLMNVVLNAIQKIPAVDSTETMISLSEAFQRQVWVKKKSK
ncbi:MAG: Lrp/AsnC ligand binding domain-containing protein [Bacteroidales bacterium]|nr:Lrp/AsnC ligand binding domain-containing protein [Bacteroidales bacterium]